MLVDDSRRKNGRYLREIVRFIYLSITMDHRHDSAPLSRMKYSRLLSWYRLIRTCGGKISALHPQMDLMMERTLESGQSDSSVRGCCAITLLMSASIPKQSWVPGIRGGA